MFIATRNFIQSACFSLLFILSMLILGADMKVEAAPAAASVSAAEPIQVGETGLQVEGRLVPKRFANLAIRSSGLVEEIFVQEGDFVESGQILLRLGGGDSMLAEIAAAEMELLLAQQGLDDLYINADLARAQAERELAQAQKEFNTAEYHLSRVIKPASQLSQDQAYANMLLAEKALVKAQDELSRNEKKFNNKNNPILKFINRRQIRLILTLLERNVTTEQKRYEDSIEKYHDLIAPVDDIDLASAEADLAYAQAKLTAAEQKHASLLDGPDPEDLAAAQARIKVAEADLEAANNAVQELELLAPFAGKVVDLSVKQGEWAEFGQPLVVLAVTNEWVVETEDLTEIQVPNIELGQGATVIPEAFPEMALTGTVESISRIFEIKSGDVTYTARIRLAEGDPRLRWGMTTVVTFEEQ
jgi:HlyD family secretion protein